MQVAYGGIFPSVNHEGDPIDNVRMKKAGKAMVTSWAITEFRGDWKWHKEAFGLSRFYNYRAPGLCHMCETRYQPGPLQFLSQLLVLFQRYVLL